MKASEIMTTSVECIAPDTKITEAGGVLSAERDEHELHAHFTEL